MYFIILFGSREVKICGSEAFDCFNPNWQVTCILVFSIHSICVFYSWHCTDYFCIHQTEFPLVPAKKNMLEVPSGKMLPKLGRRAFCYAASKLWKNLPNKISSHDSLSNFKCHVKMYLIKQPINLL